MDTQITKRDFIKRLAHVVLKMNNLDNFLKSLTEMAVEVFGVIWASLYLLDETSGQYTLKAESQRDKEIAQDRGAATIENAVPWLKERQSILSRRLLEEAGSQMPPEIRDELSKNNIFVSMPLFAGERLIGVLNLGAKTDNQDYHQEDLEVLSELAQLFGPIIERALEHHRVAEQRLHHQNILDNLVSGIVAIDPEEKITVFNRAAERILKFRVAQILGKDARILQTNLADLILDTLHKGKSYRREELYILPENTLIGVSSCQFYDSKGNLLGACMVFASLTETKKKEQAARLQNLDTYWSNAANSLAHEVKNSIVATKIFTEMFPKKYEDAEFRWNLYSTLKRDMGKLDNFTEKILKFAQPQGPSIQPCQMDKVTEAAIDSAIQDKDISQITFEKRYSQNLPFLLGDYHQLKQSIEEIINNALEAMGKGGRLGISIDYERSPHMLTYSLPEAVKRLPIGSIIVIRISDSGPGIEREHIPRLFDPFFTTKPGRTGLGLASARKIIKRHKGIIGAKNNPEGGATFWICLPIGA